MYNMLNLVPSIFPGVRAIKLFKKSIEVTNSTNPLIMTKNITLVMVDCCCPPTIRAAAHCVSVASLLAASCVSPSPITFGGLIHVITEIYEDC